MNKLRFTEYVETHFGLMGQEWDLLNASSRRER
jgi:hypothetical protein